MPELVLILVIALIVLGPTKLPEIARALGRGMAEFRRAADDLRDNLMAEDHKREETTYTAAPSPAAGGAEATAGAAPPLTSSGATVGQAAPETREDGAWAGAEGEPAAGASAGRETDYVSRELDLGGDREAAPAAVETRVYGTEPGGTTAEAGEASSRPPAEDRPADEGRRPA